MPYLGVQTECRALCPLCQCPGFSGDHVTVPQALMLMERIGGNPAFLTARRVVFRKHSRLCLGPFSHETVLSGDDERQHSRPSSLHHNKQTMTKNSVCFTSAQLLHLPLTSLFHHFSSFIDCDPFLEFFFVFTNFFFLVNAHISYLFSHLFIFNIFSSNFCFFYLYLMFIHFYFCCKVSFLLFMNFFCFS